jgi:molecular chaperone DnaK
MEAEQNAEMDKKMKEDADTFNSADSLLFQVNKSLEDLKDNISEEEKNSVNNKVEKLREAYNNKNVDDVKIFMEEVNQEFQKISEKLYNNAQDTSQDEVTNVDFEEVK